MMQHQDIIDLPESAHTNWKTLIFRPYNPQDRDLCHELYEMFKKIKKKEKIPLKISENPDYISKSEEIDESEILVKYPKTLVFTKLRGRKTPGMGRPEYKSIIISTRQGRYQIYQLGGVTLHEVSENIFGIEHHLYKGEECAMVTGGINVKEAIEIIANGKVEEKLKEQVEVYKKIPAVLCSKCRGKIYHG